MVTQGNFFSFQVNSPWDQESFELVLAAMWFARREGVVGTWGAFESEWIFRIPRPA